MIITTKKQLIQAHMNKIATILGGWKEENQTTDQIIAKWKLLKAYELKAQLAALVLCNGRDSRAAIYSYDNIDRNIENATRKLEEYQARVLLLLQDWFNDSTKAREKIFINKDPRGYALKLILTHEEQAIDGIAMDWGHYGLLAAEPSMRKMQDESGRTIIRWYWN